MTYVINFTVSDGQNDIVYAMIKHDCDTVDTLELFKDIEVELRNALDTEVVVTLNNIMKCEHGKNIDCSDVIQ